MHAFTGPYCATFPLMLVILTPYFVLFILLVSPSFPSSSYTLSLIFPSLPPSLLPPSLPHAGAVYLKNCIFRYWKNEEPVAEGEEAPYSIPDVAKAFIRENIVGAIIKSPVFVW